MAFNMSSIWRHGGDIYTKDGKFALAKPESAAGLQWIVDLWQRHKVAPHPTDMSQLYKGDATMLRTGQLAMALGTGPWIVGDPNLTNPEADWAVNAMPIGPKGRGVFLHMGSNYIAANAANPDGAWAWSLFRTTKEAYEVQGGDKFGLPARNSLLEHPSRLRQENLTARGFLEAQKATLAVARLPYQVNWSADAQKIIDEGWAEIRDGKKTAQVAMQEIEGAVNQTISRPIV
jgi:ABC-type glycerol-3-phosphate transport system substrate-binding protein